MRQLYVCRDFKSKLSKACIQFEPINHIQNVMKAAICNKHQVIIKMVKKLDLDLMVRALPAKCAESTTRSDLCISHLSKTICIWNCLDLLVFADTHLIEELKINCIKFICLNLVSFFSEGSKLSDKLIALPIYLIKDIENFLKEKDCSKFLHLDMYHFDMAIDYSKFNGADHAEQPHFEIPSKDSKITEEYCQSTFCEIQDLFHEYSVSKK